MGADDTASLAGIFSNKSFLDFVGIAIVAPVIASLIAIITARMGITGRIRRLELAEKRLDVITALLSKSDLDDELRAQLRSQMHDITAELISDYGGYVDPGTATAPAACPPCRPGDAPALPPRTAPTPWCELSRWRRWLFPPFTKSILSWVCGIFYYYLFLSFVVLLASFTIAALSGQTVPEDYTIAMVVFPLAFLFLFLPRFGMRHAFNQRYSGEVERRRVSAHTRSARVAV